MAWADIRRAAREVVHRTFATSTAPSSTGELTARYFPESGEGPGTLVSVRVHNRIVLTGDLNNEGYAEQIVEIERIIFLRSEFDELGIKRKGFVKFSDGRVYTLDAKRPVRDDYTVDYEVIRRA